MHDYIGSIKQSDTAMTSTCSDAVSLFWGFYVAEFHHEVATHILEFYVVFGFCLFRSFNFAFN